ncbi:hypothetical protein Agub_g10215, partial [Astrephomene gubernaculifera]
MEQKQMQRLGFGAEEEDRWLQEETASAPEESSDCSDSPRAGGGGGGRCDGVARRRRRRPAWTRLEEAILAKQHSVRGNAWSAIAAHLPGRSASEVKNIWHSTLRSKKLKSRSLLRAYARGVQERGESAAARMEAFRAAVKLTRGGDASLHEEEADEPDAGRQPERSAGSNGDMQLDFPRADGPEDAAMDGNPDAANGANPRETELCHTGSSDGVPAPLPTSHPSSPGHSNLNAADHVMPDPGGDPAAQNRYRAGGEAAGDAGGADGGPLRLPHTTQGPRLPKGTSGGRGGRSAGPGRGKEAAAAAEGAEAAVPPQRPRSVRQAANAAKGLLPAWQRPWVEDDGGFEESQRQEKLRQEQQQRPPRRRPQAPLLQPPPDELMRMEMPHGYGMKGGKGLPWVGALQPFWPQDADAMDDPQQQQLQPPLPPLLLPPPPLPLAFPQQQPQQAAQGEEDEDEEEEEEENADEGPTRKPSGGLGRPSSMHRMPPAPLPAARRRQERRESQEGSLPLPWRPSMQQPLDQEEQEGGDAAAAVAGATAAGAAGAAFGGMGEGGNGAWRQEKGGPRGQAAKAEAKLEKQLAELAPGVNWGATAHNELDPPQQRPGSGRSGPRNGPHSLARAMHAPVEAAAAAATAAAQAAAAQAAAAVHQKMLAVPLGHVGSLGPLAAALISASSVGGGPSAPLSLGSLASGLPAGLPTSFESLEQLSIYLARVKMEKLITEQAAQEAAAIWQVAQTKGLAGLASLLQAPLDRNWDPRAAWPEDGLASGPSTSETGTKSALPPHRSHNLPRDDPAAFERPEPPRRPAGGSRAAAGTKRARPEPPTQDHPGFPPLLPDAWAGLPPPGHPGHPLSLQAAMAQSLLFGGGGLLPNPAANAAASAGGGAAPWHHPHPHDDDQEDYDDDDEDRCDYPEDLAPA